MLAPALNAGQSAALPTPEVLPSADEQAPQIHPNLAGSKELCEEVTQHITRDFWYGYEQQQQRFHKVWKELDDAWRARPRVESMDLRDITQANFELGRKPNFQDGFTATNGSAALHRQFDALLKIGLQISWQEGLPARYQRRKQILEGAYNPAQQSVDAANVLLEDTADEIRLKQEYRKNLSAFIVYGHAWGWVDFCRRYEDVVEAYPLPQDPYAAQQVAYQLGGEIQQLPDGRQAVITTRKKIVEFKTVFKHLKPDDVFTDLMIPCDDMEAHPCPIVRQHITASALWDNQYDETNNPFGWLNGELAMSKEGNHYTLSLPDEKLAVERLQHRYNLSDQTGGNATAKHTIKQLWTAYPKLAISPEGKLDTGDGVECPHCNGGGRMQVAEGEVVQEVECQTCRGSGRVRIRPERYVVQLYGAIRGGSVCLRIQKMPKGEKVPLRFAGDLIEDTACAIPMSKGEVALNAFARLVKAKNLFERSKDMTVNRGHKVKVDSPAEKLGQKINEPGAIIPFENDPREVERVEASTFDETVTLIPYIEMCEREVQEIIGATDQLLGMLATGRRSASELMNAIDAGKNPIVVMVDGYNDQMIGWWAEQHLSNLQRWGDRDYIREKTGCEFLRGVEVFTAVGEEFVKKLTRIQNTRYILESSANDMAVQQIRPQLWQRLLSDMGMGDIEVPDGGLRKAQMDALKIVIRLLGDGDQSAVMPAQEDPHQLYVEVFTEALKDPYWLQRAPQNLPLLQTRLAVQQQAAAIQAQQQMLAEMQMAQAQQPQGDQAKRPPKPAESGGQAMQQAQG